MKGRLCLTCEHYKKFIATLNEYMGYGTNYSWYIPCFRILLDYTSSASTDATVEIFLFSEKICTLFLKLTCVTAFGVVTCVVDTLVRADTEPASPRAMGSNRTCVVARGLNALIVAPAVTDVGVGAALTE